MTETHLSRRFVLRLMGFGAAAQGLGLPALAQESGPRPFVLVLTNLPPALPQALLERFLTPFTESFLRLGIAIPAPGLPGLTGETLGSIAQAEAASPGLVELLAEVSRTWHDAGIPYFLARSLADDLRGYEAMFPAPRPQLPVTLFVHVPHYEAEHWSLGARSLGIRSVFEGGIETAPTVLSPRSNNVWHIEDGLVWHWQDGAEVWSAGLDRALAEDAAVFAHLSLTGLDARSPQEISAAAAELADLLADRKQAGGLLSVLPRELSFRYLSGSYDQSVLMLIDESMIWDNQKDNIAAFREMLKAAGIPATAVRAAEAGNASDGALTCAFTAKEDAPTSFASCRVAPGGMVSDEGDAAVRPTLTFFGPAGTAGMGGPNTAGTLAIPIEAEISDAATGAMLFDGFASALASLRDKVVLIRPDTLGWPSSRALLFDAILRLRDSNRVTFKTTRDFVETVFPDFHLVDLLHRKDAALAQPELARAPTPSLGDALLRQDAQTAFAYFQRSADPVTGLSAPTEYSSEFFSSRYETITMWDVASNIFAVLSAMELELVEREEGEAWIAKIVASIPTREVIGLTLPVAEIDYRRRDTTNRDYNACDIGRLLIALKAATVTPSGPEIEKLVAGWDIAKTVHEGKPIGVTKGKVVDASQSHCAHYLERGYALWGIGMDPIFTTDSADDAFERQMRVMNKATGLGLIGAESYGLEMMELGTSFPGGLLGDVLLAVQYETFRDTGELIAVSETPLDKEPWFSYQGLDLADPARPWKARSNPPDPRYDSEEGQNALRVFSAKAAYLAAATRPSAFSDRLAAKARTDCAMPEKGFFVGSYSTSGAVMKGYSDINTNGIILEALAYVARGRRPMLAL